MTDDINHPSRSILDGVTFAASPPPLNLLIDLDFADKGEEITVISNKKVVYQGSAKQLADILIYANNFVAGFDGNKNE